MMMMSEQSDAREEDWRNFDGGDGGGGVGGDEGEGDDDDGSPDMVTLDALEKTFQQKKKQQLPWPAPTSTAFAGGAAQL